MANLRALVDLPSALSRVHGAGSPVARLDAGPYRLAYVHDPEWVQAVLDGRAEGIAERGRFFDEIGRVIGASSLVTCAGEQHRRLRRLVATAFRPDQVRAYAETMVATTDELCSSWQDGALTLLGETMSRLTLEIAARSLLGLERVEQMDDFASVLSAGTRIFYRLLLPRWASDRLWKSRLSPANRRLRRAQAGVDRFVDNLLAERQGRGEVGPSSAGEPAASLTRAADDPTGRPANLLDVLLAAEQADGPLTHEELRDQIVTFLFAGYETTAQALTWTFVLLDRSPEVRSALEDELDQVLGQRPPKAGDTASLVYTRAVVRESLRLYPPAWFLSREADQATTVGGCPVPRGALVLSSPLVLHRDPAFFSEPLRFDPTRWVAVDETTTPAAYVPFGHGRRNCIGSVFALTELVLVVATIASRWRLRVLRPDRIREHPTVTLRPRGRVQVVLERRERVASGPDGGGP